MTGQSLEASICARFAQQVDLVPSDIFDDDLTLAEIMARSKVMRNSLDLMEAFARVANSIKREYGVSVRLPAFSLDTPISIVIGELVHQLPNGSMI